MSRSKAAAELTSPAPAKRTRAKSDGGTRAKGGGGTRSRAKGAETSAEPRTTGLTPENRRALGYLVGFAAVGFTLLSLASYSATDPALSRRSSIEDVANWCGRGGAMLADLLYQLFGWSSWAVALLGVWLGLRFLRRPSANATRLLAGGFGTWWVATFLGMASYHTPVDAFPAGGALGRAMASMLLLHLGEVGGYILTGTLLLAGVTIVFGIDWENIAERAVGLVNGSRPVVAKGLRGGLALVGDGAAKGVAAIRERAADAAERRAAEAERRAAMDELPVGDSESVVVERDESAEVSEEAPRAPLLGRPEPVLVFPQGSAVAERVTSFDVSDLPDRFEATAVSFREVVEVDVDSAVATPAPAVSSVVVEPARAAAPLIFIEAPLDDPAHSPASALDAPDPHSLYEDSESEDLEDDEDDPASAFERYLASSRRPDAGGDDDPLDDEDADFDDLDGWQDDDSDAPPPVALARSAREQISPSVRRRPGTVDAPIKPGNLESGGDHGEELIHWPRRPQVVYELPSLSLLDAHDRSVGVLDEEALKEMAAALVKKLADFGVKGEVTAIRPGPVITIFEYLPAPGIKVSRIAALTDDIAMAMRAIRVRIVAPIPGKGVVGIELPNRERQTVWYRDLMASQEFRENDWVLPMALGKTPAGHPRIADLTKMPHLLVGGTTGSGKSVGVNAMLMTMLYLRTPEELRMILIDPKMLEFELYQDIPHLLHPVVTEPKLAAAALKWACKEMDDRYRILARWGTRNIASFNRKVEKELEDWTEEKARRYAPRKWPKDQPPPKPTKFPYIVVVIDELADLMMVASKEVEESIVRLAQKARACGIHLIVATQRPSVDVITGLIKANMPSRIAFQVRSKIDGRTILDQNGAETLLGKGDMLYLPPGVSALERLHGPFVADEEVQRVADYWRSQAEPDYSADISVEEEGGGAEIAEDEYDDNYDMAVALVTEAGKASTSMIQRHLKIGYNRAARIMDIMEREGVVGPADGARPRKVLVGAIPP